MSTTLPRPMRRIVGTGRPELHTSYASDMALLETPTKRNGTALLLLFALAVPYLFVDDTVLLLAAALAYAIGAIGLNLVTGYAGQVSLGHAVFVGLGAYTAAALSGEPEGGIIGLGQPMWIWLPAAGIVAAVAGALVAPAAARLRGLYLAIVTLGLVFLFEHFFRETQSITGGAQVGRRGVVAEIFGVALIADSPGCARDAPAGALCFTREQKVYWFALVLLIVLGVLARNLARSDVGRAFAAVRDRDLAAAIIGVPLVRYKFLAFTISSFYAGICGAVLYVINRQIIPESFGLLLSVQFIAMVLIGGVATVSGSIAGALFITLLRRFSQALPDLVPFISAQPTGDGILTSNQVEQILYGLLIVGFLIFEPRGLYGVWIRIRNYWKGWPFSY